MPARPPASLAILLHAHLPFVRHPENDDHLEERWLFDALVDCYLPLLGMLERLYRDQVPVRLTLSLSPTLVAMLDDELLRRRFERYVDRLEALGRRELERAPRSLGPAVVHQLEHLAEIRARWALERGDVAGAFGVWFARGVLEPWTTAASHALLPGYETVPAGVRAQIVLGVESHRSRFGAAPAGFWLPECAYYEGLDALLVRAGVGVTALDTRGVELARPRPAHGPHAPVVTRAGLALVARDPEVSEEIWSREAGLPGHPAYREYHRDIGFEHTAAELGDAAGPAGVRVATGFKHWRVTGPTDAKQPYDPALARRTAQIHARAFVDARARRAGALSQAMHVPPLVLAPFDAELFGHWWHEGPWFLEAVLRELPRVASVLVPCGGAAHVARRGEAPVVAPGRSSWGEGSDLRTWCGPDVAWIWGPLHHGVREVERLVLEHRGAPAASVRGRALRQALRELLLAQASDWPFMIHYGTTAQYAEERLRTHLERLARLGSALGRDEALLARDEIWLADVESRDRLLPALDPGAILEGSA